jgi:hypothetical protein
MLIVSLASLCICPFYRPAPAYAQSSREGGLRLPFTWTVRVRSLPPTAILTNRLTIRHFCIHQGVRYRYARCMPYSLDDKLIVAVASSALFDLSESDRVYPELGTEKYREFQRANENNVLSPSLQ